jgi:hypothetical protein
MKTMFQGNLVAFLIHCQFCAELHQASQAKSLKLNHILLFSRCTRFVYGRSRLMPEEKILICVISLNLRTGRVKRELISLNLGPGAGP